MSVPASVEDPLFDAEVNVLGFLNLMEAARKSKTRKFIFISSGGAIYGEAEEFPTSEGYEPRPLSPYAITKYATEKYLAYYKHQYGMDYTVLRYANVYGPRQIPHGEAGVVAIFMDRLIAGKECTIYHYPEEPKGMTRDYCYVGDIVRANMAASDKAGGLALNIGTGVATHTRTLYDEIYAALKRELPELGEDLREPLSGEARPGDIRRSCLNTTLAESELGWRADVALPEGIERTLEWRLGS